MAANDVSVTMIGNLVADPELRFTPGGAAVASFTVACTPRYRDGNNEWQDGDTTFMRCNLWREMAENMVESLKIGDRVIVVGTLKQRNWEDKEGNKRQSFEVEVTEIGPSLRFATAQPERVSKRQSDAKQETPKPTAIASRSRTRR